MGSWSRIGLWTLGILAYVAWLVVIGTPMVCFFVVAPWDPDVGAFEWLDATFEGLSEPAWWLWAGVVGLGIFATQLLFLLPVVRLKPPSGERRTRLVVSLVAGGAAAALVATALMLGLVELGGSLIAGDFTVDPWSDDLLSELWIWPGILLMLGGSWAAWTMLLMVFSRQMWEDTLLGRAVVLLFAGTIIELIVVLPIDIMVRRRTDCYCATGTFFSLVFSTVAILWLAGPGVVLALTAGRRRMARVTHCAGCGHAKGPTPGPACPECGYDWTRQGYTDDPPG